MPNPSKINRIANHYGLVHQISKCLEELDELKVELKKDVLDITHTAEEIADVEIMLAQLTHLLNVREQVEKYKDFKLNRQIIRINKEIIEDLEHCQAELHPKNTKMRKNK